MTGDRDKEPGIFGHEGVLRTLGALLAGGRLGHAYRFTGPPGVGKKRVALRLARGILCTEEGSAVLAGLGCGECPSCRDVEKLAHPDLVLYHDFQSPRWEERLEGWTAEIAAELQEQKLILPPISPPGRQRWTGLHLDPGQVFSGGEGARHAGNVFDPSRLVGDLAKMEERGVLSPAASRLAATLYYRETSRIPYRGSLGIHLVARREPQTPDRGSLRENLARTSLWGRGKVAVIDDAHRMTEEAQNALLKTLEEPPPGSFLFLVTDEPGVLLPTVRSRAPEITFGRLSPTVIMGSLAEQGVESGEAAFLAAWSDGSLGRALEGDLEGLADERADVIALHRALMSGDLTQAMGLVPALTLQEEAGSDRGRRLRGMSRHLEILLLWYRDLAVAAAVGERGHFLNADLAGPILTEGQSRSPHLWRRLFSIAAECYAVLRPSSDFRLQGESLVATLATAVQGETHPALERG